MVEAEVRIEYKKGVVDAEGGSVRKALHLLGYPVQAVDTIKVYHITLDGTKSEAKKTLDDACKKLLANPVIQKYSITIL
jgi:phosphoribosylformylglycinamidine synthase